MDISMMEMMTEGFVKPSVDKRVYQILEEKGADALLITDEYNMRYIGGYTGEGCLFITQIPDIRFRHRMKAVRKDLKFWRSAAPADIRSGSQR
jgi:Xaa-Pro aminopeptidase